MRGVRWGRGERCGGSGAATSQRGSQLPGAPRWGAAVPPPPGAEGRSAPSPPLCPRGSRGRRQHPREGPPGAAGAAAAGFALCRVRSERGPVSYCNSCFPRGVAAFGAEMGSGCRVSVAAMKLHVNGLHLPPGPAVRLSGGCGAAETPQPQPRFFAVGSGGTQQNKPCRDLGVTD